MYGKNVRADMEIDMEKRLSINDIDKLYTLALHLVDIIDMAPFKSKK